MRNMTVNWSWSWKIQFVNAFTNGMMTISGLEKEMYASSRYIVHIYIHTHIIFYFIFLISGRMSCLEIIFINNTRIFDLGAWKHKIHNFIHLLFQVNKDGGLKDKTKRVIMGGRNLCLWFRYVLWIWFHPNLRNQGKATKILVIFRGQLATFLFWESFFVRLLWKLMAVSGANAHTADPTLHC